jgi:hypothetical protein
MEMERSIATSTQVTCIVCPPEPEDYDRMADLAGQLGTPMQRPDPNGDR